MAFSKNSNISEIINNAKIPSLNSGFYNVDENGNSIMDQDIIYYRKNRTTGYYERVYGFDETFLN